MMPSEQGHGMNLALHKEEFWLVKGSVEFGKGDRRWRGRPGRGRGMVGRGVNIRGYCGFACRVVREIGQARVVWAPTECQN